MWGISFNILLCFCGRQYRQLLYYVRHVEQFRQVAFVNAQDKGCQCIIQSYFQATTIEEEQQLMPSVKCSF